jgi:hypothetical protein
MNMLLNVNVDRLRNFKFRNDLPKELSELELENLDLDYYEDFDNCVHFGEYVHLNYYPKMMVYLAIWIDGSVWAWSNVNHRYANDFTKNFPLVEKMRRSNHTDFQPIT